MSADRPSLPCGSQAGSPVRSGDPPRDWDLETTTAAAEHMDDDRHWDSRQLRRMSWRAEGAQDYPGGALDTLLEISHRARPA